MQIVHGDEVEVDFNSKGVRTGKTGKQLLLGGDPESPGNFKFGLFRQYGDFFSPRHRHNFCQFRFQLEGDSAYGQDGKLSSGTLGYFPEGTHYGPQGPDTGDTYTAVLQFGGPSGQGMLTPEQTAAAARELEKIGLFEKGVFRRNSDVEGKKNVDGFQAVWEQVAGRKLVYPESQYARPILMHLDNFKWMPLPGMSGVSIKALGTFTDCVIPSAAYRLEPGAEFIAESRGVYLVLCGGGSLEGETFRQYTSLYIDTGETARFKADQVSEILLMGMPNVADILQHEAAEPHSEAAE